MGSETGQSPVLQPVTYCYVSKMKIEKLLVVAGISIIVSACNCGGGAGNPDIRPVQKTDKQLSCKDIILEINEAEFYKRTAVERKQGRVEDVLFPYCYPSGYLNANSVQKAAEQRLEYLNQIYDLLDCDAKSRFDARKMPAPTTTYQDITPVPIPSAPVPPRTSVPYTAPKR